MSIHRPFRFLNQIRSLLTCSILLFMGFPGNAQSADAPPYIGNWSNGRAFELTIGDETMTFDSKGNPTVNLKYTDVSDPGSKIAIVKILNPNDESLFAYPYVSILVDDSTTPEVMSVNFYSSYADIQSGKDPEISDDSWTRDGENVQADQDADDAPLTADVVVASLYDAHAEIESSPFFQSESRDPVDQFFTKTLADLIWKDSVASADSGEQGALGFDPLFDAQDTDIKDFEISAPTNPRGPEVAVVEVTFKNMGTPVTIAYELMQDANGNWKINNILYDRDEDLLSIYKASLDG